MIRFPTNQLILEGPDCVGKSTMYNETHRKSGFRWNIQDRSWLSMLVYARLYGRDIRPMTQGLWDEMTCLNNRVFLLMPPWETVQERFQKRGDDFQDLNSLEKIYTLFDEYGDDFQHLPNVTLLDNSKLNAEDAAQSVVDSVSEKENYTLDEIAAEVLRFVSNVPNTETAKDCESTLSFTFYDDLGFEEDDPSIMSDHEEGEYYTQIKARIFEKIESELAGHNEYGEPQTGRSRRFVYSDDTCISFIQVMYRKGVMDVHTVLRSSNVAKTFIKDLRFIYHLAASIFINFGDMPEVSETRFRFNINSAHLVR